MIALAILAYVVALIAGAVYELIADRREHISQQEVHRMRKGFFLGAFLFIVLLALAVPLAAQEEGAPPFVIDEVVVAAILGLGGIGLAYVANFLKLTLKLQGKAAVILVLVLSIAATAGTLLISHTFGWLPLLFYSAAVFGEMTGWYKLGPGMKKATI